MTKSIFPVLVLFFVLSCQPQQQRVHRGPIFQKGAVAAAHPLAAEVGKEILSQGGNAYDAAIAVQFALAVVMPRAGNIGGGGFMVSLSKEGKAETLDFRESAPQAAHADLYLDEQGVLIKDKSLKGHLAAGVPGTVRGMEEIHKAYGSLPWYQLLAPAIQLAKTGFVLSEYETEQFNRFFEDFKTQNTQEIEFLTKRKYAPFEVGDSLLFADLAKTLGRISLNGADEFYKGATAELIVNEMQRGNGIITAADLAAYRPIWRAPILINYKNTEIISMPLPSAGGIALAQLFHGSKQFDWSQLKHNGSRHVHLMTELQRRVYADRAIYLGDADFYHVPIDSILHPDYLDRKFADITEDKATPSSQILAVKESVIESIETTHFSIVDQWGNAVAVTTTLNGFFGNKVMVGGAGFFLNNEMDDFTTKVGEANQFGLVGNAANAIAPQKRMLSSMTPTIVKKDGEFWFVLGSPGGSTIITNVYQTLLNVIEFGMSMQEAVDVKKMHSQWIPDEILYEINGFAEPTLQQLTEMGHQIKEVSQIGRMNAVMRWDDGLEAAADHSRKGDATAAGI